MSSLDRMMANLIGDATGLPVRGLVRKIGARNLLLLGGAAIAGGVLADSISRQRASGSPATAATPPPPPPRSPDARGLPPLPPVPVAEPAPDAALDAALLRTMAAAALADGRLDETERAAIRSRLDAADLSDEQAATVRGDLVMPPEPEELARLAGSEDSRHALFRAAWLVTRADGELVDAEAAWLDRLATALGLDAARRRALEDDLLDALTPSQPPVPPPPPI